VNEAAFPPSAVVVGCSAGGLRALHVLLAGLAPDFAAPLIAVCHTGSDDVSLLCELLSRGSTLPVHEAAERTRPAAGNVYIAPSGYHLLLDDGRFVLSVDPRVGFARPSIDVLFDSVAATCGARTIGVVLTGANSDGAAGLKRIRERGGIAVVQEPRDAEASAMPAAALEVAGADHCVPLTEIPGLLNRLVRGHRESRIGTR
jgi:two-component system chemotaxis response regulator CheB